MIRRPPRSTLFPSTTLSRSMRSTASAISLPHPVLPTTPHNRIARQPYPTSEPPQLPSRRLRSTVSSASTANSSCDVRSEEHTSELQSPCNLVCRLLLEKKNN